MRKLLMPVAALAIVAALAACTPQEDATFKSINHFRQTFGRAPLTWEEGAYAKAHNWSKKMAHEGRLSHSNLAEGVPAGWRTIGENVAMAPTLDAALRSLQSSPPHRANLLNPAFKRVAVGVYGYQGRWWVTQVFIG